MLKFDFYNHTKQRVEKKLLKKLLKTAEKVLVKEKKISAAQDFCFELSLIGLAAMARINKKFRGKNHPTDVISLSYFNENAKSGLIGEIFICMPYAIKQAKKPGNTLNKELQFLFIHGLLHIFGYDHKKKPDAKRMERLTKEIIKNTPASPIS